MWPAILGGLAAGAASSLLSKKPSGNTTTSSTTSPWIGQQGYLTDLWGKAQSQYGQPMYSPTTTGLQNQFLTGSQDFASGGTSPLMQQGAGELSKTMSGGYSNPFANPVMQDAANMTRSSINAGFQGDNYGNSAHQEWLGRGITNALMPYASGMYENERNRQMQASQLAPVYGAQEYSQDLGRLGALGTAAGASGGYDQAPWDALTRYQQAISGGGYGSTTSTQPYFTNPMNNMLGGALGGAALYGAYGGGAGGGSPEGANLWGIYGSPYVQSNPVE